MYVTTKQLLGPIGLVQNRLCNILSKSNGTVSIGYTVGKSLSGFCREIFGLLTYLWPALPPPGLKEAAQTYYFLGA